MHGANVKSTLFGDNVENAAAIGDKRISAHNNDGIFSDALAELLCDLVSVISDHEEATYENDFSSDEEVACGESWDSASLQELFLSVDIDDFDGSVVRVKHDDKLSDHIGCSVEVLGTERKAGVCFGIGENRHI